MGAFLFLPLITSSTLTLQNLLVIVAVKDLLVVHDNFSSTEVPSTWLLR